MKKITHSEFTSVVCDLCGKELPAMPSLHDALVIANQNGWDWFTGDGSKTQHYCGECKTSERAKRALEAAQRQTKAEAA